MLLPLLLAALASPKSTAVKPPTPLPPVPSERQIAWHHLERYAFAHFGPNTFTDKEWGEGKEDPNVFNPSDLDCRQWVHVLKAAGMTQLIITAKHHDGFCLWPSKFSTHTVAQSAWKDGKGDVLKELSEACKAEGLKMGVYLSPWDRNHPTYGTPEYNKVFSNMLTEVLGNYGPISEVWFDGANGEGPNGKKQVYDWKLFHETVRKLQPKAVMFSDAGPDVRWVGNEDGHADVTNWSTISKEKYYPGMSGIPVLTQGDPKGSSWVPAECDVSIRPGWFYHPEQDTKVKTPEPLVDLYYRSVGMNASFLLNVPPDRQGHIHLNDIQALQGMNRILQATFKTDLALGARVASDVVRGSGFEATKVTDGNWNSYWAAPDNVTKGALTVDLGKKKLFDRVVLQEYIPLGQRVQSFTVEAKTDDGWHKIGGGTTIGYKRILLVPATEASQVRVSITSSKACPTLSTVSLYASPSAQDEIRRDTAAQHEKRMAWFRDSRFGMFIHWGLYSVPAGVWNDNDVQGAAEWLQYTAKVKPEDYEPLQQKFNPVNFDAKKWVAIAKNAGMKYIVITSKHHEGFGMWPSKLGTWNIGHSQFKRDLLKELAQACKDAGIRLCFYHSIMDWHEPNYLPRRTWDTRDASHADFEAYVKYMKGQLKELLTNYGPISILWFDGEWEDTWTHDRGKDLYFYIRSLQPNIIVNNRVDTGRSGMAGMTVKGSDYVGDYGTPEQTIPANGIPGQDWESCMTMNDTWGFSSHDHNWKSSTTLIRNLVDCASKGGNYLLNVGPTSLGEIPDASVERLSEVGEWMHKYSESVYGTTASPFSKLLPWGRVTQKPGKLYLHVFDHKTSIIDLPGMRSKIKGVHLLGDPATKKVPYTHDELGVHINLPAMAEEASTVFVVELDGKPVISDVMVQQGADGTVDLTAVDAKVTGSTAQYEADKHAIGFWTNANDTVNWTFNLKKEGEYRVQLEYSCEAGAAGSTFEIEANGGKVKGKVASTGAWTQFAKVDLGVLTIVRAGPTTLTVRALLMSGFAVMNLKGIRLIPK